MESAAMRAEAASLAALSAEDAAATRLLPGLAAVFTGAIVLGSSTVVAVGCGMGAGGTAAGCGIGAGAVWGRLAAVTTEGLLPVLALTL